MKLVYFDDFKLGVVKGDAVVDVSAEVKDIPHTGPGDLMNGLIERWDSYRPRLEAAVARGAGLPLSGVRIRPPVPGPRTIDCMAVNYMEDGTRSEPAPINAFQKSPNAIIGNGDTMVLTDIPATIFEGEAEIALVIGKRASNVKAADAFDYIFGYMNFIDGSARGVPAGFDLDHAIVHHGDAGAVIWGDGPCTKPSPLSQLHSFLLSRASPLHRTRKGHPHLRLRHQVQRSISRKR